MTGSFRWERKVITDMAGLLSLYRVSSLSGMGQDLASAEKDFALSSYKGEKAIANLSIFPLAYHEYCDEIKETLKARGRKFVELRGFKYRHYKGLSDEIAHRSSWTSTYERVVSSRFTIQ
jgi:hypothetical protein